MEGLLSVRNLTKHYHTRHGVIRAVEDVSFEVAPAETLALVGESGCGKTTVALALLRLIDHDGGQVVFDGMDIDSITGRDEDMLRQKLSIVFQNPYSSLNPRMRIQDIVGEPIKTAYNPGRKELEERVVQHLSDVGLGPEHLRRYPALPVRAPVR